MVYYTNGNLVDSALRAHPEVLEGCEIEAS
jgi:hypothetical protein